MGMEILVDSVIFFNDTATTEISTLSLHDALPISVRSGQLSRTRGEHLRRREGPRLEAVPLAAIARRRPPQPDLSTCDRLDRKSTRLNSSHANISYAVFCLKKTLYILSRSKKAHLP